MVGYECWKAGYDEWKTTPPDDCEGDDGDEETRGAGYEELETGIFVPEEDAYRYALERLSQSEDEQREFVEWYYSGNWIHEYGRGIS